MAQRWGRILGVALAAVAQLCLALLVAAHALVSPSSGAGEGERAEAASGRRLSLLVQLLPEQYREESPYREIAEAWTYASIALFIATPCVGPLFCCCYWRLFIKHSAERYIPANAVIPDDLKGGFKYGVFGCLGDLGTCCCFLFCNMCTISDLWYRSGHIHAFIGDPPHEQWRRLGADDGRCPGWQWFVGVLAYGGIAYVVPCSSVMMPCVYAVLRGGGPQHGDAVGPAIPMRMRFQMEHDGVRTFVRDCCCWFWLLPCVGTQEYRHVTDLLSRPELKQEIVEPIVGQVVGNPIRVEVGPGQAQDLHGKDDVADP